MTEYIVPESDSIKNVPARDDEIALHFQSNTLADAYLNGMIDWHGNKIGPGDVNHA